MPIGNDTNAYRRRPPHLEKPGKTYFVTFCTLNREILAPESRTIALDCCLHDNTKAFWLHAGVIMPEHAHLLLTPFSEVDRLTLTLATILGAIKGVSSHRINDAIGRSGRLWQEESFDRILRSRDDLQETAEYIIMNPVRRGLVSVPDDYPWIWRDWVEGKDLRLIR